MLACYALEHAKAGQHDENSSVSMRIWACRYWADLGAGVGARAGRYCVCVVVVLVKKYWCAPALGLCVVVCRVCRVCASCGAREWRAAGA